MKKRKRKMMREGRNLKSNLLNPLNVSVTFIFLCPLLVLGFPAQLESNKMNYLYDQNETHIEPKANGVKVSAISLSEKDDFTRQDPEDLWALESGARLLNVGKHEVQHSPAPYATNTTSDFQNPSRNLNYTSFNNMSTQMPRLPPVFIRVSSSPQTQGHFNFQVQPIGSGHLQPQIKYLPLNGLQNGYNDRLPLVRPHSLLPTHWPPHIHLHPRLPVTASTLVSSTPEPWSSLARFVNQTTAQKPVIETISKNPTDKRLFSEIEYEQNPKLDSQSKGSTKNRTDFNDFPIISGPESTFNDENIEREYQRPFSHSFKKNDSSHDLLNLLKTAANTTESLIVTNRSSVSLLCDTNEMFLRFKFEDPFDGIIMTNLDRSASCQVIGTGDLYYEMRIPLRSCGTRQESPRLFINNINIHFRPTFDFIEDETKTVICSYPIRPQALPQPDYGRNFSDYLERIVQPPGEEPAKLTYYQPYIVISVLLLVSLALLGLTTGAYIFAKQRRNSKSRWSKSGSFGSSRIYQSPRSQAANLAAMRPPLLSVSGDQKKKINRTRQKTPNRPSINQQTKKRVRSFREQKNPMISVVPIGHDGIQVVDSLASRSDESTSVTTIEIPYSTSNKPDYHRSNPENGDSTQGKMNQQVVKKYQIYETNLDDIQQTVPLTLQKIPQFVHEQINDINPPDHNRETFDKAKSTSRETPVANPNTDTLVKSGRALNSFRSTLTTPQEFRRLENIYRLFKYKNQEPTFNRTRSKRLILENYNRKYSKNIEEIMSSDEIISMAEMLRADEVFRSRVVESIDAEKFNRKLRHNPAYKDKFSPRAWNLIEKIFTDSEIEILAPVSRLQNPRISSITDDEQQKGGREHKDEAFKNSKERESTIIEVSHERLEKMDKKNSTYLRGQVNDDSLDSDTNDDSILNQEITRIKYEKHQVDEMSKSSEQEPLVRISQFNSTQTKTDVGIVSIDSITKFESVEDFTTFTTKSIHQTSRIIQ